MLFHPRVARVSCRDCQTWLYEDWELVRRPARVGLPVRRPKGMPTPCHKCPKIPDEAPKSAQFAAELSDRNRRAYLHYLECEAVGRFPDDPIVARNAAIIRGWLRAAERSTLDDLAAALLRLNLGPAREPPRRRR